MHAYGGVLWPDLAKAGVGELSAFFVAKLAGVRPMYVELVASGDEVALDASPSRAVSEENAAVAKDGQLGFVDPISPQYVGVGVPVLASGEIW